MTDTTESIDDLIARAAAGGPDALEAMSALYLRMNQTVYNWVRQYITDGHLAEDLSQEVWMKVSQKARLYQPGTNLVGWLSTITRNTVFDYLRTAQRRPDEVLHADYLELDQPRPGLTPHQYAERKDLARAIESQMGKLRPEQRRCLQLRFYAGCTPAHTAEIMGKTEGAVRVLTVRSLRKLAKVLPAGDSSAELVEELLTIAVNRGKVVGVRVQTQEAGAHHVATR
ncbi:RNA polymerase sigma factor [Streptomyces sp. NPDC048258]|uniref:RNA polymerase sigma factor n=1 Tax=Streptomyces sp. NPDC048258 TaxID=3365527 RepID=UPI00371D5BAC